MVVKNRDCEERLICSGRRKLLAYDGHLMSVQWTFPRDGGGAIHKHPHEQITYIVSGKLIFHEEGREDVIVEPGDTTYIAPDVMHGLTALEDSVVVDIFTPLREDFLA